MKIRRFTVYEKEDVKGLINVLQKSLKEAY